MSSIVSFKKRRPRSAPRLDEVQTSSRGRSSAYLYRILKITPRFIICSDKTLDSFETFCFMMVEEFLMRKRMLKSLAAFRDEWPQKDNVRKFSLKCEHL